MKLKSELTVFTCFALGIIILGIRLQIIHTYGGATPYWDDWGLGSFLYNHMVSGSSMFDLLRPANEHRMFFSRMLNIVLFRLNENQWDPLVSMAVNAVLWASSGLFLLLLAHKNRCSINPYPFILVVMVLWGFPTALVNVIWGVQSHNYFMILFVLVGCWYIGNRPFSLKWMLGVGALAAACLTMAGGAFAAVAVACVYLLKALFDRDNSKQYMLTVYTVSIVAAFGLFLIFVQKTGGGRFGTEHINDFMISLGKTLSWPLTRSFWPWLIFFFPVLVLALKGGRGLNDKSKNVVAFTFSLCLFVVIVSIAIAYARGVGGYGPTRRYSEFLSISIVSSVLALLILQKQKYLGNSKINTAMIMVWLLSLIASIPTQLKVFNYTVEDRAVLNSANEQIVRDYIITGKESVFEKKRYRHVPYPDHKILATILDDYTAADMLPVELQVPTNIINITNIQGQGFVKNGSIYGSSHSLGVKYRGENVIGSYNTVLGAQHAKGTYKSEEFESKRSYLIFPTLGFLGREELSLQLVEVDSGSIISVIPRDTSAKSADSWASQVVKVPEGKYRIIASDQSDTLWFAFAAPRSMGKLSYLVRRILKKGEYIWQLGVLLLLLSIHRQIVNMFRSPGCTE